MKTLVVVLCVMYVVNAAPTEDKKQSKRARGQCWTSEGIFNHGDWVSPRRSPCLKYRCNQGKLRFESAGCPFDRQCYNVGSTWSGKDCHTYRCEGMAYNSFKIVRETTGCIDAYQKCRRPGEHFPYVVNGRIYRRCSCRTTPYSIKYSCDPE